MGIIPKKFRNLPKKKNPPFTNTGQENKTRDIITIIRSERAAANLRSNEVRIIDRKKKGRNEPRMMGALPRDWEK